MSIDCQAIAGSIWSRSGHECCMIPCSHFCSAGLKHNTELLKVSLSGPVLDQWLDATESLSRQQRCACQKCGRTPLLEKA